MNLNRFRRFIPWSRADPRASQDEAKCAHYIGVDWTPDDKQIDAARARHAVWCANPDMRWRRIVDAGELEVVRASVISATAGKSVAARGGESVRILRILALHPDAQFFERKLEHMEPLRLLEFRHPLLTVPNGSAPLGYRFIRLVKPAWRHRDFVCLYLDGDREAIDDAFGAAFHQDKYTESLVEQFVRFAFDHLMFEDRQYYVVEGADDFIHPDSPPAAAGEPDRFLTAQFQLGRRRKQEEAAGKTPEPLPPVKIPPAELLILPTVLDMTNQVARVFATVVAEQRMYHVGMEVSSDGKIVVERYALRTENGEALPLVPVRSFYEQRAALHAAFAQPADAGAA